MHKRGPVHLQQTLILTSSVKLVLAALLAKTAAAQSSSPALPQSVANPMATSASSPAASQPADEVAQVEQEYRDAYRAFMRAYRAEQRAATQAAAARRTEADEPPAEAEPDWSKLPVEEFAKRFRALAEQHAGRPQAIRALAWLASEPGAVGQFRRADAEWALHELTRAHAGRPEVEHALGYVYYVGVRRLPEAVDALCDRVLAVNRDRQAQASALFYKALILLQRNYVLPLSPAQREEHRHRALEYLHRIERDYADLETAKLVAGHIYEAEHLQIGMVAPEIIGTDADGRELRLSHFRGRVVLLIFWGLW
ncbi:MAG: hypothetical protein AB1716_09720 [Planctomycetota bacterium]